MLNKEKMKNKDFYIDVDFGELEPLVGLKLPDPTLLDLYMRMGNREIWWNDIVDDTLVEWSYQVIQWNRQDKDIPVEERKPIIVYVNSDGGSVDAVMNFIDVLLASKTPVHTVGLGKCYSSGALLFMAGKHRYLFDNTTVLIHNGSTGMGRSDIHKFINMAEFTKKIEEKVGKYILGQTNISEELYKKQYKDDWWLFADECVKLGIATEVITDLDSLIR